jgi:hypothetical protein
LYGYGNKIDQIAFYREIISLPTLEVNKGSDYIWEENGKYWTFAANTATFLYLQSQVNIQQRKIDNYSYRH